MDRQGRTTDLSLAEQMQFHEIEISSRKALLGFDHADVYNLTKLRAHIEHYVDDLVEEFYVRQTAVQEIALIIGDADTLERLKAAQRNYILDLFSGEYDKNYVNNRLRIGMIHKRIGVEPKYYLSALFQLKDLLLNWIRSMFPSEQDYLPISHSLDKLLVFDTQLVFDTYIRSLVSEIELSKHQVENYAESLESIVRERTVQLEEMSQRDHLTGLFNRRVLDMFASRYIANASRQSIPVTMLYFDVDDFKAINDERGHAAGDRILSDLGRVLLRVTRQGDIACRLGGDEFCMLMLNCTREDGYQVAERLIEEVRGTLHNTCSISIGLSTAGPDAFCGFGDLQRQADSAMYAAKEMPGSSVVEYSKMAPADAGLDTSFQGSTDAHH